MTKKHDVNLVTWGWKYDQHDGGWLFKAGEPSLRVISVHESARSQAGFRLAGPQGEQSIHVEAKQWRFSYQSDHLISATDDPALIEKQFRWLDGIIVESVEFADEGWVCSATFEGDVQLVVEKQEHEGDKTIATWFMGDEPVT